MFGVCYVVVDKTKLGWLCYLLNVVIEMSQNQPKKQISTSSPLNSSLKCFIYIMCVYLKHIHNVNITGRSLCYIKQALFLCK